MNWLPMTVLPLPDHPFFQTIDSILVVQHIYLGRAGSFEDMKVFALPTPDGFRIADRNLTHAELLKETHGWLPIPLMPEAHR